MLHGDAVNHGLLQVRAAGDFFPLGAGLHLHSDPTVLVYAILDDLLVMFSLPDNLGQLTPLLGKLKIKKNIILTKVAFSDIVPASKHASSQDGPRRARSSVGNPDNKRRICAPPC